MTILVNIIYLKVYCIRCVYYSSLIQISTVYANFIFRLQIELGRIKLILKITGSSPLSVFLKQWMLK